MQAGFSTPKKEGEKKPLPPYTIRLCLCRTVQSPANEAPQNSLNSCNLREIYFCKRALHIYLKVKSIKRALRHRKKQHLFPKSPKRVLCLHKRSLSPKERPLSPKSALYAASFLASSPSPTYKCTLLQCIEVCCNCSVMQCVPVCCSVLQWVAVGCSQLALPRLPHRQMVRHISHVTNR